MKHYDWILFDADDTLFKFDAFKGLQRMFVHFGVNFTEQDFVDYQVINKALWVEYQNGDITAQQLKHRRFAHYATQLQVTPEQLSTAYLTEMVEVCVPLEGATALLDGLKGKVKLGIITNGFVELQQARLVRTGFLHHFDVLVISEQVGVAKPDPKIFDYALSMMGNPAREKVLMVGDNPASDILGGINAGLETCWLTVENKPLPLDVQPHYQVRSLKELEESLSHIILG